MTDNTRKTFNFQTSNFAFYDISGENYFALFHGEMAETINGGSAETLPMDVSNALIVVIDPLTLADIAHDVTNGLNNEEFISLTAAHIKKKMGIPATGTINIPVAVVLTKMDVIFSSDKYREILNVVQKPSDVLKENGKINAIEFNQVNNEIIHWLQEVGEFGIVETIQRDFRDYCFFGVSSYGTVPPAMGKTPDNINPHRVVDPFVWLFTKLGLTN